MHVLNNQNIQNDTGKLATNVAKERELSAKLVAELQRSIVQYKNTPMTVVAKEDPYVYKKGQYDLQRLTFIVGILQTCK